MIGDKLFARVLRQTYDRVPTHPPKKGDGRKRSRPASCWSNEKRHVSCELGIQNQLFLREIILSEMKNYRDTVYSIEMGPDLTQAYF